MSDAPNMHPAAASASTSRSVPPVTPRKSLPGWALALIVVAIAVASFAVGAYLVSRPPAPVAPAPAAPATPAPAAVVPEPMPSASPQPGSLTVDWIPLEQQQEVPFNAALKAAIEQGFRDDAEELVRNKSYQPASAAYAWRDEQLANSTYVAYALGTVQGGTHDGAKLVLDVFTGLTELGPTPVSHLYVLEQEGKSPILLTAVSDDVKAGYPHVSFEGSGIAIDDQSLPDGIALPADIQVGTNVFHHIDSAFGFSNVGTRLAPDAQAVATAMPQVGAVEGYGTLFQYAPSADAYDGIDGGFFTIGPDGRRSWYDLEIPFWGRVENQDASYGIPNITWTGYRQNNQAYIKGYLGGCGVSSVVYERNRDDLGELVQIGGYYLSASQTRNPVYGPVSYDTADLQGKFKNWQYQNPDGTLEQFVAAHPVFYWQDGLGRWIEFTSSAADPLAECGKPVIYLYPPSVTDVSVKLAPAGGFTKSEPAYGDGWQVSASPDGSLVNAADGETYPYLFWEGRGGLYVSPERYWVVARADVHGFLTQTLAQLGLNAQETADFQEFWEPRMQAASYYKIGFHGTRVMDAIAPMNVTPAPDTVLRVLMDYQELSQPMPSRPPTLAPVPARRGFTVIEWGGVLR